MTLLRRFAAAGLALALVVPTAAVAARADEPVTGDMAGQITLNGVRGAGMWVTAEGVGPTWDYAEVVADSQGRYRLTGLEPGQYRVQVSNGDFPDFWFPGVRREREALPVTVTGLTMVRADITGEYQPNFPGHPHTRAKGPRLPAGLSRRPLDSLGYYDGQSRCIRKAQRGTKSLARLLTATYGDYRIGLNRACVKGSTSEHYDGRAIDWMVNSRVRRPARAGDDFVKWLTMARGPHLGVMAARIGVMYVIWRGRIWKSYDAETGWQEYENCLAPSRRSASLDDPCHRSHVHISLTWAGARKATSWWQ
ncbi:MAG: carboxypeptidase-like regulatory domain-containing protein [Candidatus Nanopelagicales bacterium]